jgi:hypothetical protein
LATLAATAVLTSAALENATTDPRTVAQNGHQLSYPGVTNPIYANI